MTQRLPPGGPPVVVTIVAHDYWNHTGIEIEQGQRYDFLAEGEWKDWTIATTPQGFTTAESPWYARPLHRLFESRRRVPEQNWFALIGTCGEDDGSAFLIGRRLDGWRAPFVGELVCFANDYGKAYGNNRGAVHLRVSKRS
jgi:hypothetical protein